MVPATPPADPSVIVTLLPEGAWRRVEHVLDTGSTNADLAARARQGEPGGLVLIAEHQSAGRGRLGRTWQAPPGASLAVSVLLTSQRPAAEWSWLPLLAGIAVQRAVRGTGVLLGEKASRVQLKWPNDVLLDPGHGHGGKLCGILCERVEVPGGRPAAVLGMGINTDLDESELPVPTATSLRLRGVHADKNLLVVALLTGLADLVRRWDAGEPMRREYLQACTTIGRRVRVDLGGRDVTGTAVDVDRDGRLVVETEPGHRAAFSAGDVVHLR